MCEEVEYKTRKTKTAEQAKISLVNLCVKGEKSSGDAIRLMAQWDVPKDERGAILEWLVSERFIDDRRYASAYIREKSRFNGWGVYKIRNGLYQKGVSRDIINETISELDTDQSRDKLVEILNRKLRSAKETDIYKLKSKLMRQAISQGYEYDVVISTIDKLLKDIDFSED